MAGDVLPLCPLSVKDVVFLSLGCCRAARSGAVSYTSPLCGVRNVNRGSKQEKRRFGGIKGFREGRDEVRSRVRIEVCEEEERREVRDVGGGRNKRG